MSSRRGRKSCFFENNLGEGLSSLHIPYHYLEKLESLKKCEKSVNSLTHTLDHALTLLSLSLTHSLTHPLTHSRTLPRSLTHSRSHTHAHRTRKLVRLSLSRTLSLSFSHVSRAALSHLSCLATRGSFPLGVGGEAADRLPQCALRQQRQRMECSDDAVEPPRVVAFVSPGRA